MAHAGGRPTLYEDELTIKKAQQYISSCRDEQVIIDGRAGMTKVKLPKAEGLCLHLGVTRSTLYKWAEEHPEFSDILDELNQEQAERLIDNGLSGAYNSTIVKLVLAKHGYRDSHDTDVTSKGEKLQVSVIDYGTNNNPTQP